MHPKLGLSPLTRGNPRGIWCRAWCAGPIPAHAGQPPPRRHAPRRGRAYPRSRGATRRPIKNRKRGSGLSPLTRGNPELHRHLALAVGPIPAHAGQPPRTKARVSARRAYPRSRGATSIVQIHPNSSSGLSPLTRGNRAIVFELCVARGPIPAHAGQPRTSAARRPRAGAYPRSRGATCREVNKTTLLEGLSPLTRGNLNSGPLNPTRFGPIPAHAGQPRPYRSKRSLVWAYPRSRGATIPPFHFSDPELGLSPLTRGNRGENGAAHAVRGPIPAHAGQPSSNSASGTAARAYPRSRGATVWFCIAANFPSGLSPLTRGNRAGGFRGARAEGPIPAHAGQPEP